MVKAKPFEERGDSSLGFEKSIYRNTSQKGLSFEHPSPYAMRPKPNLRNRFTGG